MKLSSAFRLLTATAVALALFPAGALAKPKPDKPKPKAATLSAPEFDARSAGAALALLLGGILVLAERRRTSTRA